MELWLNEFLRKELIVLKNKTRKYENEIEEIETKNTFLKNKLDKEIKEYENLIRLNDLTILEISNDKWDNNNQIEKIEEILE